MSVSAARRVLGDLGLLHGSGGRSWLEVPTSGTTTTPRTLVRSLASWEGSFDHLTRIVGMSTSDRVLVPAAPTGSMFAFALTHAAWLGAEVEALDAWSPAAATAAAATCTVAHATPSMLAALLDRSTGSLRTVIVAGAAVPTNLRQRASEAGVRVVDYYGAAELSFVAIRSADDEGRLDPFPEVEVDLRDGVIWARSPWLADGYAPGQRGPMTTDAQGFATVGDRGHLEPAAGLVVTGRGDSTITTGGTTVIGSDVEHALCSMDGVAEAVVVGTPHATLTELVEAVVVPSPGQSPTQLADELPTRAAELIARGHLPRRWHVWAELPQTPLGKVDRGAVLERLLSTRQPEAQR